MILSIIQTLRFGKSLALAGLFLALIAGSQPGRADPVLPSASYTANVCGACLPPINGIGTTTNGNATATTSGLPSPSVTTNATGPGSANAEITYFAEFVGPAATLPVDLSFTISASASNDPGATARAEICLDCLNPDVIQSNGLYVEDDGASGGSFQILGTTGISSLGAVTGTLTQSGTITRNISEGTVFEIIMRAEAGSSNPPGTESAFVDPMLFIDSSFAAIDPNFLGDYQLFLSPGVGNSESVPEPLALSLFGAGFAGVVAMRRRAKRTSRR